MDARMASKSRPRRSRGRSRAGSGFCWSSFSWCRRGCFLSFVSRPCRARRQMLLSLLEGEGTHYSWVPFDEIAPSLPTAVIAAEDQRFCSHHGFDWVSIDKAVKEHEHGRRLLRGASTISQQAARSLFLVPVRSWVRKGAEAYLTVLMEALWPKQRILTAYLNLVDWGRGNYGAEAAAQAYFHVPAADLSPAQSARLAAILPDPDEWNAARPGPYVARRAAISAGQAFGGAPGLGSMCCVKG